MIGIRHAWQTRLAKALGDTVTTEADAARVVATLLRIAQERQGEPGFGERVARKLLDEFRDEDTTFRDA